MTRGLNGWRLFWTLAAAISIVDILSLGADDFRTARGTAPAIVLAVRCALPFFVVAFTASSAFALWPGRLTRWVLTNRRYFGLTFAFGMAWHFAFVGYSLASFGNRLNGFVTTLDVIGLVCLAALTVTSFRPVARRLSARNWRRLHKTGVYVIWLLATFIYAEAVRSGPGVFDVTAMSILLAAWGLRFSSWIQRQRNGRPRVGLRDAKGSGSKQPSWVLRIRAAVLGAWR